MKTARITFILLPFGAVAATVVLLRTSPPAEPAPGANPPEATSVTSYVALPETNRCDASAKEPVQSLEERGDAMLFEIEALKNTPFDEAVTHPHD